MTALGYRRKVRSAPLPRVRAPQAFLSSYHNWKVEVVSDYLKVASESFLLANLISFIYPAANALYAFKSIAAAYAASRIKPSLTEPKQLVSVDKCARPFFISEVRRSALTFDTPHPSTSNLRPC